MHAILSAAAESVSLFHMDVAEVIWINGRREEMEHSRASSLYREATDAIVLENCSKDEALASLHLHWRKDRALLLLLMLFDKDFPSSELPAICEQLDQWLSDKRIFDYVKSVMFSRPLGENVDLSENIEINSITGSLVKAVIDQQPAITRFRKHWESISAALVGQERQELEARLISMGVFWRVLCSTKNELQLLKFECLSKISGVPDSRNLIIRLLAPYVEMSEKAGNAKATFDGEKENEQKRFGQENAPRSRVDQFSYVKNQIEIVRNFFAAGEPEKADNLLDRLIKEQLNRKEAEYAVKTLCNASEAAKSFGFFENQLAYAKKATEIAPSDAISQWELGDACLNVEDYQYAQEIFGGLVSQGNPFGMRGLAKVYRKTGRLQEARELSVELLEIEPEPHNYALAAEICRDLKMFDEAIAHYNTSLRSFPNAAYMCGLAATHADAGDYLEALGAYQKTIDYFPDYHVSYTGKGHLLARLGQRHEALAFLRRGITLSEGENRKIATCALVSALRILGKSANAISWVEQGLNENSDYEEYWVNLIEILIENGKGALAASKLTEATDVLGRTPQIELLEAKLLHFSGRYDDAFETVDRLIQTNPAHIEAYLTKIGWLRLANKVEHACQEYQKIPTNFLSAHSVIKEGIILGLNEVPDDALKNRARTKPMATLEDWEFDHACGVNFLAGDAAKKAWRLFLDGKKKTQFKRLQKKFRLALAFARDRLGRFGSMKRAIQGHGGIEVNLVAAIAYWKMGLRAKLAPQLVILRKHNSNNFVAGFLPYFSETYRQTIHEKEIRLLESDMLIGLA